MIKRYIGFKFYEWGKIIGVTMTAQAAIQLITLISGILIIRTLSTQEYAFYTLANTMLSTMTLLADGGIATGVMAQGGKVWKNRDELGVVISTGLHLRKIFGTVTLVTVIPLLILLLNHNGASNLHCILLGLATIPAFFSALSGSLFEIIPKLKQEIFPLQKIQVINSISRLTLLVISLFFFPFSFVAVLGNGLPQIWANWRMRKMTFRDAKLTKKTNEKVKKEIISIVKRILPVVMYYCISGQITIWILSVVGSTTSIAQIGALGRLAMIFSVQSVLFNTVIAPRFARLPSSKQVLKKWFLKIILLIIISTFALMTFVYFFADEILSILGSRYSNLKTELILTSLGGCLNLFAGSAISLYTHRGWAINPFISIPVSFASLVIGAFFINLSDLKGILFLNLFMAFIQVLLQGGYCVIRITRLDSKIT